MTVKGKKNVSINSQGQNKTIEEATAAKFWKLEDRWMIGN